MVESLNEFWKLVAESELLKPDVRRALHMGFAREHPESDSAKLLAEWLIARHKITVYHAKALLSGLAGPFFFGDYEVLDRLPGGDVTRRLQAIHTPTGHHVILHFWADLESLTDEDWEKACAYAARHEAIVHPNLDRCYETLTRTKHRIAVTEDVKGRHASEELNEKSRLPISNACDIIRQAALGLDMIHRTGLVHGRIQTTNVCIQANGHAKLLRHPTIIPQPIDFDAPDLKGRLLAAADYYAPELAGPNRSPNPATDIYALGCVLFELLQGRPPFAGGKLHEKMVRHSREPIQSLEGTVGAPRELAEIVAFMLAKDYKLRFPNASDIVERLERFSMAGKTTTVPIIQPTEAKYLSQLVRKETSTAADRHAHPSIINPDIPAPPTAKVAGRTGTPQTEFVAPIQSIYRTIKQARRTAMWLAAGTLLGGLASISVIAFVLSRMTDSPAKEDGQERTTEFRHEIPAPNPNPVGEDTSRSRIAPPSQSEADPPADSSAEAIEDDGISLWVSPTHGPSIETRFLSSGSQLIGCVNVAAIMSSEEGKRSCRAMGPTFNAAMKKWIELSGLKLNQIDSIVIGAAAADDGSPRVTLVMRLLTPISTAEDKRFEKIEGGHRAVLSDRASIFVPDSDDVRLWVIRYGNGHANQADSDSSRPQFRRELESLLSLTDAHRHITLVSTANRLTAEAFGLYDAEYSMLKEPIAELLGDMIQSLSLSLHFEPDFFGELIIVPTPDADVHSAAQMIRDRIVGWPTKLSAYLNGIADNDYGRRLAVQFPLMVRTLAAYSRVVAEPQRVTANFVLPARAAHNLILASEIALTSGARSTVPRGDSAVSIADILAHRTSLSFDRQSLEFALRDLANRVNEDVPRAGFSIQIIGTDLQADGITRNQQIVDFSQPQATVGQILTALVMRANPVTTVKSPSEKDQKLVWVAASETDSPGPTVLITTRQAAAEKGYPLPDVFGRNESSRRYNGELSFVIRCLSLVIR